MQLPIKLSFLVDLGRLVVGDRRVTVGERHQRVVSGSWPLTTVVDCFLSARTASGVLVVGLFALLLSSDWRLTVTSLTTVVGWLTVACCRLVLAAVVVHLRLLSVVDELSGVEPRDDFHYRPLPGLSPADDVDQLSCWHSVATVACGATVLASTWVLSVASESMVDADLAAVNVVSTLAQLFFGVTVVNATWLAVVYLLTNASVAG